jgi:hypothetical protein
MVMMMMVMVMMVMVMVIVMVTIPRQGLRTAGSGVPEVSARLHRYIPCLPACLRACEPSCLCRRGTSKRR